MNSCGFNHFALERDTLADTVDRIVYASSVASQLVQQSLLYVLLSSPSPLVELDQVLVDFAI
jgi:hypothetical protein